jgi:GT2 family glycosyltransferase
MNVNPGYLPRSFVSCLARSYKAMPKLMAIQEESSAIPNLARTKNGKAFLESEAEWALLVDSDMMWEPVSIIQLLQTAQRLKAKVVSGITFMEQKGRIVPHAYAYIPDNQGGTALAPYAVVPSLTEAFKVEAVGGACLLVHRDVYQDVKDMTQKVTAHYWQEDVYSPKNHEMKGEDLVFSERIRAAGYDIWYEPRAPFMHLQKPDMITIQDYIAFLDGYGIDHPYQAFS